MKPAKRFLAALAVSLTMALAAVGAPQVSRGSAPRGAEGVASQAGEIVRAHNEWRRRAGVSPLRWAADLAAMAQARADRLAAKGCVLEHEPLPEDVGENLFRVGPWRQEGRKDELSLVTPTEAIDAWGSESAHHSPVNGTCAAGRECAHYTQIVSRTTEEVGCGTAVCPAAAQIWACNYRPRGNVRTVR